ncbi:MAG: hypothetical protein WCJ37_10785 [Syntrophus sp. (in: bacteria)]
MSSNKDIMPAISEKASRKSAAAVGENILLTLPANRGILVPTIPAKPLNDAQIGGLLFCGDKD